VIAGSARGRRLLHPGAHTRPLGDRVKQAIFGSLEPILAEARVLDLFAGSGAGGIEALSRGAGSCDFVERDPDAVHVIEANLRRTALAGSARVHRRDVGAYLSGATGPFDVVLVDPPYGDAGMLDVLRQLGTGTVLQPGSVVVARHFWRKALPERVGHLARLRERRIGEGVVTVYRLQPQEPAGGPAGTGAGVDSAARQAD
jgi:16S rRNA (guanine966-N2)-methyltransferase